MKNVFVWPNIKYKYIDIYIVWNTYFGFLIYCLKHSGWHRPLHKSASTSTTPVPLWSTAPWGVHQLLLEVCNVHQLWPQQNPIQCVPLTIITQKGRFQKPSHPSVRGGTGYRVPPSALTDENLGKSCHLYLFHFVFFLQQPHVLWPHSPWTACFFSLWSSKCAPNVFVFVFAVTNDPLLPVFFPVPQASSLKCGVWKCGSVEVWRGQPSGAKTTKCCFTSNLQQMLL